MIYWNHLLKSSGTVQKNKPHLFLVVIEAAVVQRLEYAPANVDWSTRVLHDGLEVLPLLLFHARFQVPPRVREAVMPASAFRWVLMIRHIVRVAPHPNDGDVSLSFSHQPIEKERCEAKQIKWEERRTHNCSSLSAVCNIERFQKIATAWARY